MPQNLKWKQGCWWARKEINGIEREKKLFTASKTEARKRRDRWIKELRAEEFGETPPVGLREASGTFVSQHLPTLQASSARRYETSLIHLIDFFGDQVLGTISVNDIYAFEQERRKDGVQSPTIRRDMACLSSLFMSAILNGFAERNPVMDFRVQRKMQSGLTENEPRTRYLSHDEEEQLLRHATDRSLPLMIFAIDTGLRRSEQFLLKSRFVNISDNELTVPRSLTKSGRERSIPLKDRAHDIVKHCDNRSHVFINSRGDHYSAKSPWVWEQLQKAARRAGIDDLRWHDLRRTCGCRLLQDDGFEMHEVSQWLGHSSVTVTEKHYAFLKKDQLHSALARKPHKNRDSIRDQDSKRDISQ